MKISCLWLRDYLDCSAPPEELRDSLSAVGLVVESIHRAGDDSVLDIEIPSNRPDCLSHIGIARELSAIYDRELRIPRPLVPEAAAVMVPVRIDNPELCGRYSARVVRGVRIGDSPEWLKNRLVALGQRPINNIVDATNYVLQELGHPLHAFDLLRLEGPAIVVRRALPGERLTTLDGVDRELDPGKLVIADAARPVALAGIMGGESSEISDSSSDLLIESAYFDPICIGEAARALQIRTEASHRFERGADLEGTAPALDRCVELILKLAGGTAGPMIDVRTQPPGKLACRLRRERLHLYGAAEVPDAFVASALERLGFTFHATDDGWDVAVPSHRGDVTLEVDLIEEVLRHFGYQNIPSTLPPWRGKGGRLGNADRRASLASLLRSLGYSETLNWTLMDPRLHAAFGYAEKPVELKNPLSEDASQLRTHLLPNLVQALRHNQNHGSQWIRLFEIGKTFVSCDGVSENEHVAWAAMGSYPLKYWNPEPDPPNYHYMKGILEKVLECRGASGVDLRSAGSPFLSPAQSAEVLRNGTAVGWIGCLHPALQESLKLKDAVFVGELSLDALGDCEPEPYRYRPVSRFPGTFRDFSFLIDLSVPFASVQQCVLGNRPLFFKEVELIDLYRGAHLPAGKLSMALRFYFENPEGTLTEAEIQNSFDQIVSALRDALGVIPR